jgi:hypothetical protein
VWAARVRQDDVAVDQLGDRPDRVDPGAGAVDPAHAPGGAEHVALRQAVQRVGVGDRPELGIGVGGELDDEPWVRGAELVGQRWRAFEHHQLGHAPTFPDGRKRIADQTSSTATSETPVRSSSPIFAQRASRLKSVPALAPPFG